MSNYEQQVEAGLTSIATVYGLKRNTAQDRMVIETIEAHLGHRNFVPTAALYQNALDDQELLGRPVETPTQPKDHAYDYVTEYSAQAHLEAAEEQDRKNRAVWVRDILPRFDLL
jgi:hypothetical protein